VVVADAVVADIRHMQPVPEGILDRRVAVDHTEAAEDKAGRTGCNRRVAGAEHRNRTEERRMKDTASVA